MYRDYGDKVQFFYVYKTVEHPEVNGIVSAFNIEERLKHIAIAKEKFKTEIPFICDTMKNAVKEGFKAAPNAEFVIDPEGKIVRKRFWSSPKTLRADLEELVGKSETTTKVEDIPAGFVPEPRKIASGVVPKPDLPAELVPIAIEPVADEKNPFFAKLRVEVSADLIRKKLGYVYFAVYLDPIYKVHWNNRAGKVKIEFENDETMIFALNELESEDVKEDADIDPRHFLVEAAVEVKDKAPSPMNLKLTYTVCDDAETFCKEITQEYKIVFNITRDLGSRPGVFLNGLFADVRDYDKNGDGNITTDELPEGKVTLYTGHIDYNGNDILENDEIDRFLKMFNNGKGVDPYNDGAKPKDSDQ